MHLHIKKGFLKYKIIEAYSFAKRLINWYTDRKRNLPWRSTKDAYPVWLSEIILQQTRVDQGLPYWERFVENYPTIADLAKAPEENVLRLWQGLGYYSRARNLHATAKYVHQELTGVFPSTFDEIIKLKGVGPYTAAAIASICFDEPTPVVDGNVFRFASRYFGIKEDISLSGTRKVFEIRLSAEIDKRDPGSFNQAMMEFGATVCLPNPLCDECPFQSECFAFHRKTQHLLPLKTKKTKVRNRNFHYVVFREGGSWFMNERVEKDVWSGLYDFHLQEGDLETEDVLNKIKEELKIDSLLLNDVSESYKHILSHQRIRAVFYQISLNADQANTLVQNTSLNGYSIEEVLNLPKPKLIVNYLENVGIK